MRRNVVCWISPVLLSALLIVGAVGAATAQETQTGPRTYVWFGDFVSVDSSAKIMTVKAAVNEAVSKYLDRFKPGDHIGLIWTADNSKAETGPVRYIEAYDALKSSNVNQGYLLPVELVAADASARTITFKAAVPDAAIRALAAVQPGRSIAVTAPMSQPSETAVITSVQASDRPQAAPQPKANDKPPANPGKATPK